MNYWKNLSFCLLILFQSSFGFLTYLNTPPKRRVQVYHPHHLQKNETNCVIFFGGGSNSISHRIYDSFLSSLQHQNVSVYMPCFKYQYIPTLVQILRRQHKSVVMMGHSSGCNTLLNHCNQKGIRRIIMMDPVKTSLFRIFYLFCIRSILILQAMKSYRVSYNPFGLPFIPSFLKMDSSHLKVQNNCVLHQYNLTDYGHSDILNQEMSNAMHFTRITVGHENRSYDNLKQYHNKLSHIVATFIQTEKIRYPTSLQ